MHTLTRESQEVTVGSIVPAKLPPASSEILRADISHCGQLNSTISALLTPTKPGISVKSNVISAGFERIVSSGLAHMSPSSPVSVGMCPSNRTLETMSGQAIMPSPLRVGCGQCPTGEDPFTDCINELYCAGNTCARVDDKSEIWLIHYARRFCRTLATR